MRFLHNAQAPCGNCSNSNDITLDIPLFGYTTKMPEMVAALMEKRLLEKIQIRNNHFYTTTANNATLVTRDQLFGGIFSLLPLDNTTINKNHYHQHHHPSKNYHHHHRLLAAAALLPPMKSSIVKVASCVAIFVRV
jgi:hypothetical protein